MDYIRQKRLNESPIINVNKQIIWQSLNKKFDAHIKKSINFKSFKNKLCIVPKNKFINEKIPWGVKKIVLPKSSRSHNRIGKWSSENLFKPPWLDDTKNLRILDALEWLKQ